MKYLVAVALLILTACEVKKTSGDNDQNEVTDYSINEKSVEERKLIIQDVPVRIVHATVITYKFEFLSLYLIETPSQSFSFSVRSGADSLKENLSGADLDILRKGSQENFVPVDLKIEQALHDYAVLNVLNLQRCRSVSIVPELENILGTERQIVYFAINNLPGTPLGLALRWNIRDKSFQGFQKTSVHPAPMTAFNEQAFMLITPNSNVRDENGDVLWDSAFLSVASFNSSCDMKYDANWPRSSKLDFSADNEYLPEFDAHLDGVESELIADQFMDAASAFGGAMEINAATKLSSLSLPLVLHAKQNPLFKKFYEGNRHE